MGNPYADEFLNCVFKRTESDLVVRIGTLLLIVIIIPLLLFIFDMLVLLLLDIDTNMTTGAILFMLVASTFILYLMIRNLGSHTRRDEEWMRTLKDYAASKGKDVSALQQICDGIPKNRLKTFERIMIVYTGFLCLLVFLQSMYVIFGDPEDAVVEYGSEISFLIMIVQVMFIGTYQFITIQRYDRIQKRFTEEFAEIMKPEFEDLQPMVTGVTKRRPWLHIIATILTLSLYAVHLTNVHIVKQWAYEEDILKRIMELEGATGVIPNKADYGKGIMAIIKGAM